MTVTVFTGDVLTMDPARPRAEVVVVEGDRIVAVGPSGTEKDYPHADTVRLAAGRTLLPGFIDAHTHLCIAALHPRWADLSGVRDPEALRDALLAQARAEPDADWIRGVGFTDLDGGYTPTRADLDALGLDRPVIAVHYSYHQCVVSSQGLDALGISERTPDPPGGTFGRTDGTLNGLLVERAFSEAHARSMAPYCDPDRWGDHVVDEGRRLLRDGITCVHDAACPPSAEKLYRQLARDDRLPVGVVVMPHAEALLSPLDASRLDGPPTGDGDARLAVGAVKLFADGGVLPAIAGTTHGHHVEFGFVFGDLDAEVASIVERGFRVAVHALGNRGLDAALDAFTAATTTTPTASTAAARHTGDDQRWRIEHATLLNEDQAKRMAQLGAIAVVQPGFVHHMGGAVDGFELDEATWMPFAHLAHAHVPLAASSDAPCAFDQPLLTSARGVTRRTSSGSTLGADQSLPYEEWLRAYTAGAAYAGGQEHLRGRLAAGLQADLVVLEGPLDAEHTPFVAETWVAGDRVYAAPDGAAG